MKALLLTACGAGQFREVHDIEPIIKVKLRNDFVLVYEEGETKDPFPKPERIFKYFTTIEDPKSMDKLAIYKETL